MDPAEFDEIIRLACRTNAAAPAVPARSIDDAAVPRDCFAPSHAAAWSLTDFDTCSVSVFDCRIFAR